MRAKQVLCGDDHHSRVSIFEFSFVIEFGFANLFTDCACFDKFLFEGLVIQIATGFSLVAKALKHRFGVDIEHPLQVAVGETPREFGENSLPDP